jgi:hypothetical protein
MTVAVGSLSPGDKGHTVLAGVRQHKARVLTRRRSVGPSGARARCRPPTQAIRPIRRQ